MVQVKTKKPMGRPRLHKTDQVTVAFRTSQQVERAIRGAISTIKLVTRERDTPIAMVIMDALKARLKALGNMDGDHVDRALRVLDRALDSYGHIKR